MKKLLFFLCAWLLAASASAQNNTNEEKPVYLRFPTVPQFTVFKAPDSTKFTREDLKRNKPTIIFVFSPECGHCQHETEMMIKNMDKLKGLQILMVTYLPYNEMIDFYNNYKLSRFSNITVARDAAFFFPVYYKVRNFPSFYIYDKKGNFKQFLEGDISIDKIVDALKS